MNIGDKINSWVVVNIDGSILTCVCSCQRTTRSNWLGKFQRNNHCIKCSGEERSRRSNISRDIKKYVYSDYKSTAKKKSIDFQLDYETFKKIVSSECYYCKVKPCRKVKILGKIDFVNGVDRLDSKVGYREGNIVPCCTRCNLAKGTMSEKEFIDMAIEITKNIKLEIPK